jgi:hypothetical protein
MNKVLQLIFFAAALCVSISELRSSDKTDTRCEVRMYLEDHEITTGDALAVAVRVDNRSTERFSIGNRITFQRIIAASTQPSTQECKPDDASNQVEHAVDGRLAPGEGLAPEKREGAQTVVVVEGPFTSVDRPWLTVNSTGLISTISLEQNQDVTQTASTPTNVFAKGEYRLRAVLYDGSQELASSKWHRLEVKQETFESRQRRLRIFKGLPPGTTLAPAR